MADIMLVDDYEIFRKQLKALQCWKNERDIRLIGEADNGAEALKMLRKQSVDILLTDIKMPKLNGLELLEHVKQENLCKCVILLSEYADFEYARKGIVLGAFDYIVKPVTNNSLSRVLRRATKFLKDEEEEKYIFSTECKMAADSILTSGNNFEVLLKDVAKKCFETGGEDVVKSIVWLMDFARETAKEVINRYHWIQLLTPDVEEICNRMLHADDRYMASALFEDYMMELYVAVCNWHPIGMSALSEKVADYILAHPYDKLTLTDTAEVCYVSNTYLSHSFKKDMGKSFVDYVVSLKMQIVKKFLTETDMSMVEIAEKLGYEDYKYMGRLFKKMFGFTLSDYKRMQATD